MGVQDSYVQVEEGDSLPLSSDNLPPRILDGDSVFSASTIQQILAEMRSDSARGRSSRGGGGSGRGRGRKSGAELEKLDSFGKWVQDMCPPEGRKGADRNAENQSVLFHVLDFSPAVCCERGGQKVCGRGGWGRVGRRVGSCVLCV